MRAALNRPFLGFTDKQTEWLRAFADLRKPFCMLKTGRGGSKTFLSAYAIAAISYAVPGFTCTVLGGSEQQGGYLYDYYVAMMNAPSMESVVEGKPMRSLTRLRGGGWVRVLTAGEKSVQGPHPHMLLLDEACSADPRIIELALGQLQGSPGEVPLFRAQSTPTKLVHWFRDRWKAAAKDEKFEWTGRHEDCPWISEAAVETAIRDNSKNWSRIHIDGEFGSATGTVFDWDDVEAAEIEAVETHPLFNAPSVVSTKIGVDWGYVHPTVLTVTKRVRPAKVEVMKEGRRIDVPDYFFVTHVEGWSEKPEDFLYGRIRKLIDDENTRGDLYLDAEAKFQNESVRRLVSRKAVTARPVAFSKDKMAMIGHATMLLEQRRVLIPMKFRELLDQLATYSWEETMYQGSRVPKERPLKVNDDFVDSFVLSLWGHRRARPGMAAMRTPRPQIRRR